MGEITASRKDISRLFGRAAFGARTEDLDRWTGKPYADAVEFLLNVPPGGSGGGLEAIGGENSNVYNEYAYSWWLNRMLTTPYPLEERMTLFWHDHFANAVGDDIWAQDMVIQNQAIRRNALGTFRTFAYEMTIDPAMLRWLDGDKNGKGAVNENFSRELLELFTLGVIPQVYTEADIREAAKALTGWVVNGITRKSEYVDGLHDKSTKTVLGTTISDSGIEEYKRVIDAALDQQLRPGVTAKFLAYKMVENFAYQPQTTDLFADPDPLVDEVAAALSTSIDLDIKAGMRALLNSDHFRNPSPEALAAGKQVVRQPIECLIHMWKALDFVRWDYPDTRFLQPAGQVPFNPPNVGGWLLGEKWLTRTKYLGHYALAYHSLNWENLLFGGLVIKQPPPTDIATGGHQWAAYMGLDSLSPTLLSAIESFLASGQAGNEYSTADGIFILIASSPDWQVM